MIFLLRNLVFSASSYTNNQGIRYAGRETARLFGIRIPYRVGLWLARTLIDGSDPA